MRMFASPRAHAIQGDSAMIDGPNVAHVGSGGGSNTA